ncbi:1,4-alpha-glucan branching protein GlgB [Bacillus sp. V3B]|uniref:1,4-alpha-glucan branching protein GlgB n=1 Tax=Bacillus sp. V3B TaxID=2804915 RepID=UPI0021099AA0|nr:1,4-alpha-glucan branching protein GlgB [Bacillus sp. V3B]MCQ6274485.1 1,4-alpha-glucan branching protein GlgB [Bacillus sp. V3B]
MAVKTLLPSDYQLHLFHEGNLYESYKLLGSHVIEENNKKFTKFVVWAPNAQDVRIVGDFNHWNGDGYSLNKMNKEGIWTIILNENLEGSLYKYEIITLAGENVLKADPYAYFSEVRPNTASIVYSIEGFQWEDSEWLNQKLNRNILADPIVIYEVHLGSWKIKEDGSLLSYKELATELIPHVLELGFTHIELLPIIEHPLDISWGYQGTGYFSVTSRYGIPHDFMFFINECHKNGLGVILDWVPGHFCKDTHGLYKFDGTFLYDYPNENDRENPVWGTANFNLGKNEVQSFLISNVLFWIRYFHIDGFRLDAVSNLIYWPNQHGKVENKDGALFLKKLNTVVFEYDPSTLMIAEDSTDWPQVTQPVHYGGLGFNYKWNMGWMNDVLSYMETPVESRRSVHEKMTFSLLYAFNENFVLPFSHDEVVHGKKSLLDKMPGDYWKKFAQLRLLLGYMMGHPGKKLLFMGFELGQFSEWKDKEQLDWDLLEYDMHKKVFAYVKELLKFYKGAKPLYNLDHRHDGFEWIDVNNTEQSIFSFIRKGENEDDLLVFVCNFTPSVYHDYRVGVPLEGFYHEMLNTDEEHFGGSGVVNKQDIRTTEKDFHGKPYSIKLSIPPYGISVLKPVKKREEKKGDDKEKVYSYAFSRRKRK